MGNNNFVPSRFGRPFISLIITHLVDGLRGHGLDLGGRGVDGVGDVGLEGDEEAAAVGDALAEAVVQVGVLVDQAVVARRPVQVHERRAERRDEACRLGDDT